MKSTTLKSKKPYDTAYYLMRAGIVKFLKKADADYLLEKFSTNPIFINSICRMSHLYSRCLNKDDKEIKGLTSRLNILGRANLEACFAYTLYDYLRDGKIDTKRVSVAISLANLLIQKSVMTFMHTAISSQVCKDILRLCSTIDKYYLRSIDNKISFIRLAKHSYEKSIGMAIVPLIVTTLHGHSTKSSQYKNTLFFFKHYLCARQLSDDLDDVEEDIKRGIITPATILYKTLRRSKVEMTALMRRQININLSMSKNFLKNIKGFNADRFIEGYVIDC